jgi:hypothetical protein
MTITNDFDVFINRALKYKKNRQGLKHLPSYDIMENIGKKVNDIKEYKNDYKNFMKKYNLVLIELKYNYKMFYEKIDLENWDRDNRKWIIEDYDNDDMNLELQVYDEVDLLINHPKMPIGKFLLESEVNYYIYFEQGLRLNENKELIYDDEDSGEEIDFINDDFYGIECYLEITESKVVKMRRYLLDNSWKYYK